MINPEEIRRLAYQRLAEAKILIHFYLVPGMKQHDINLMVM